LFFFLIETAIGKQLALRLRQPWPCILQEHPPCSLFQCRISCPAACCQLPPCRSAELRWAALHRAAFGWWDTTGLAPVSFQLPSCSLVPFLPALGWLLAVLSGASLCRRLQRCRRSRAAAGIRVAGGLSCRFGFCLHVQDKLSKAFRSWLVKVPCCSGCSHALCNGDCFGCSRGDGGFATRGGCASRQGRRVLSLQSDCQP